MDLIGSLNDAKEKVLQEFETQNKNFYLFYNELLDLLLKQKREGPIGGEEKYSNLVKEFTIHRNKEVFKILTTALIESIPKEKSKGKLWLPETVASFIMDILEELKLKNTNVLLPLYSFVMSSQMSQKENYNMITGYEVNRRFYTIVQKIYQLCELNNLKLKDKSFIEEDKIKGFDLIFSLIPFMKKKREINNIPELKNSGLPRNINYTSAYILKSINHLQDKGYAIYMVPVGILRNERYQPIREYLIDNYRILSVIELPKGIFTSSAIKMSLLIIQNTQPKPENVLLASFEKEDFNKEKADYLKNFKKHLKKGIYNENNTKNTR